MKIDYHIHSKYSGDCNTEPSEIVKAACSNNYSEIAFTDHIDFLENDHRFVVNFPDYFREILRIKKSISDKIIIKTGVEIGEYHLTINEVSKLFTIQKPELIIGSIHMLPDGKNLSVPFDYKIDEKLITEYYQQNLNMVENCQFDILGHLGIYKRYLDNSPDEMSVLPLIRKIFKTIISKEIALEVNYSALRKRLQQIIPEPSFLRLYKEMGGKLITVGSDSHTLQQFDDHYSTAINLIREIGFTSVFSKTDNVWTENKIDSL
ncbi:MAG: histidinol-phosphatase HisJ family protein [Candidatus Cloacimonetes bacterium]|nr:histidinol-phosphatase HisJ family protein [Candidatus Cloacimonadota bacterium]